MIEIYKYVRDDVRQMAPILWRIALAQPTPVDAADFLNNATNFLKHYYTEDEINFLQFYFSMKTEEANYEDYNSER